jgi:hypothetical protein
MNSKKKKPGRGRPGSPRDELPMPTRLAATMSLIVFAVCLIMGIEADNPFTTTVERSLEGMAVTLVVGLIVGAMGQKMIEESVNKPEKSEIQETKPKPKGR